MADPYETVKSVERGPLRAVLLRWGHRKRQAYEVRIYRNGAINTHVVSVWTDLNEEKSFTIYEALRVAIILANPAPAMAEWEKTYHPCTSAHPGSCRGCTPNKNLHGARTIYFP